jgi:hypothetical protein
MRHDSAALFDELRWRHDGLHVLASEAARLYVALHVTYFPYNGIHARGWCTTQVANITVLGHVSFGDIATRWTMRIVTLVECVEHAVV